MNNLIPQTRREFLFSLSGTAALMKPTDGKGENTPPRTRIAVIGCGGLGECIFHYLNGEMEDLPQESTLQGISLVDIDTRRCDRLALRRKKSGLAATAYYSSLEQLLEAESNFLGGVFICTPDTFHFRQCIACLERSIPVYCASPISLTSAEAERMISLSVEKKTVLYLENSVCLSSVYQFARDNLLYSKRRNNLLGDVVSIHSHLSVPSVREWRMRCGYKRLSTSAEEVALEKSVKEQGYRNLREYREWPFSPNICAGPYFLKLQESVLVYRMLLGEWPVSICSLLDRDDKEGIYGMMFLLRYRVGRREFSVTVSTLSSDSLFRHDPLLLKDVICSTAGELTLFRKCLQGHSIARISTGGTENDIADAKASWSRASTEKGCLGTLLDVDIFSKNDTMGYDDGYQVFLKHARGIRNEWQLPEKVTNGRYPIFAGVDEFMKSKDRAVWEKESLIGGYASVRIAEFANASLGMGVPVEIPSETLIPKCFRDQADF